MSDAFYANQQKAVVNRLENAVITNSDAVKVLRTHKLSATGWAWFSSELLDDGKNSWQDGAVESAQILQS